MVRSAEYISAIAPANAATGTIACSAAGLSDGLKTGPREVTAMSARFWARKRAGREDGQTEMMTVPRGWLLNTTARCDRCGAQACVRFMLPGRLELLIWAPPNRQRSSKLAIIALA